MQREKTCGYLARYGGLVLLCALFAAGIVLGLVCWGMIELPFRNPFDVHGPLTAQRYNPKNNIARFACFSLWPVVLLWAGYLLSRLRFPSLGAAWSARSLDDPNSGGLSRKKMLLTILGLVLLSVFASLNIPTDISTGPFDPFHEGEPLGTAALWMRGEVPYRDFIMSHGPFQDPLRCMLAFSLMGRSIGATRCMHSALKVLEFVLLALLVAQLFRAKPLWSFSVLIAFLWLNFYSVTDACARWLGTLAFMIQRDLLTLAFLIVVIAMQRQLKFGVEKPGGFTVAAFAAGFIPFATFAYTLDRGILLTVAYVVLSLVLYVAYAHTSRLRRRYIASSVIGMACGVLLLSASVQWNLWGYVQFSLLTLPGYWDLLFGLEYPIYTPVFLAVTTLAAANLYWMMLRFIRLHEAENRNAARAAKRLVDESFEEIALLVCSLLLFTSALGRADWPHLSIGANLTYLLSIIIIFKHYAPGLVSERRRTIYAYSLAAIVLIGVFIGVNRIRAWNLIGQNFPLRVTDAELVPEKYKAAARFLTDNLRKDETFYTLTSEGIWYYLVDKPCPTRFPVVVLAAPNFLQKQVVRDLDRKNVKFIITWDGYWSNCVDDIDMETRFPIILSYILRHYRRYKQVEGNEIWIKR